jgi:hypothetical protein
MGLPKGVQEQAERANQAIQARRGEPPATGPEPDIQPPPTTESVDWEKRFKNMKRSHDDTVSELRNQNEELSGKVEKLTALLEKAEVQEPAAQEPIFTPEEVEEYGQGFLDMVTRVAKWKAKCGRKKTSFIMT